jgi:hypothetical protein
MPTDEEIRRELGVLQKDGEELLTLCKDLKNVTSFSAKYQAWYSRALKVGGLLGPDRLAEMIAYYRVDPKRKAVVQGTYVIQDYLNGVEPDTYLDGKPYFDIHGVVFIRLTNQLNIISSLETRIGTVLADVRGQLLAEIQDAELRVAGKLLSVSLRAAGALAGVVIEGHLQGVAANHSITIAKRNPTIADLNEPLRVAAVYDVPTWRRIQHLADIRNYCDHKKEREPTEPEVTDLITGASTIIKTVF